MKSSAKKRKDNLTFKTSRFGDVEVAEEDILTFPEGLIGFANQKRFGLFQHGDPNSPFFWLQSLEEPTLAIPLTNPVLFHSQYKIPISGEDQKILRLANNKKNITQILVSVVIPKHQPGKIYMNLQGPIVINWNRGLAKQLVLNGPEYPLRFEVGI